MQAANTGRCCVLVYLSENGACWNSVTRRMMAGSNGSVGKWTDGKTDWNHGWVSENLDG